MRVKYPDEKTFSQIKVTDMFSFEDCNQRYTALKTSPFYSEDGCEMYNAIDVEDGQFLTFDDNDRVTVLDGYFVVGKE